MAKDIHNNVTDALAATIAHEIKNPLSLIQANINYIELCDKDKTYAKNYDVVRREVENIHEMLLDFINKIKPVDLNTCEEFDVYEVVSDIICVYEESVEIPIDFLFHKTKSKLFVLADKKQLSILFTNVIRNSIEAISDSGKIDIILSLEDNNVIFEVKDDGHGLSNEVLSKINSNQMFTTKKYGSGLGINICRKIVSELKGVYEISNVDGGGCKVKIVLPIAI